MGTVKRLNTAKRNQQQAENSMPGAYENQYAQQINDRLAAMDAANTDSRVGGYTTAEDSYQDYRRTAAANAKAGAAAAAGTAGSSMSGGYGASWANSAAGQSAGEQIADIDTALSSLRGKAIQEWRNELSGTADDLTRYENQAALERAEYDGSVDAAQTWRDYTASQTDAARQQNSNFWSNVAKWLGNSLSAAKAGYDGYMGYTQQQWENQFAERQYNDSREDTRWQQQRTEQQDRLTAANQILYYLQQGSPELARQAAEAYGYDTSIIDSYDGIPLTTDQWIEVYNQIGALSSSGADQLAGSLATRYGLDSSEVDTYSQIAGRQLQAQKNAQSALGSGSSGSSRSSSGSSRSGSYTSGTSGSGASRNFTTSQLISMGKEFATMDTSDLRYEPYKEILLDAGLITDTDPTVGTVAGWNHHTGATGNRNGITAGLTTGRSMLTQGYSVDDVAGYLKSQGVSDGIITSVMNQLEYELAH